MTESDLEPPEPLEDGSFLSLLHRYQPHAIVFFSSACIMTIEVVAGRLIARHLGSSLYTWTSIIAVVLAGMSIGNYIGGRMADKRSPKELLGWMFMVSSMGCLSTLMINNIFARNALLDTASFPVRVFFSVLIIFILPALVLGTISPAAAKMALDVGRDGQRKYLDRFGLLGRPSLELPEVGAPITPRRWGDISTMTASFGHGLAVSPVQFASAFAAMVNGGVLLPATLIKRKPGERAVGVQVISERTSNQVRRLLRAVVEKGTGRKAQAPGFLVGGKTGTAEKAGVGGYSRKALISSFAAAFPMTAPKYVVYLLLDEPQGDVETHGFAGAGWTAAPLAGRVISRIAPILGVQPVDSEAAPVRRAMAMPLYSRIVHSRTGNRGRNVAVN